MTNLLDVFRFFDEYDFLKARLSFMRNEFDDSRVRSCSIAFVPTTANNGSLNNVNRLLLDSLCDKYPRFRYVIFDIPSIWLESSARSAEDFCFEYISSYVRRLLCCESFYDVVSFSDLDEIFDRSLFVDALQWLPTSPVVFAKMLSCYYRLDVVAQEDWPGTFFFAPGLLDSFSLGTLKYSAHHPLRKENTIYGGAHLSYFMSTLNSKVVNSHFVRGHQIRLLIASFGLHPFLRSYRMYAIPPAVDPSIAEHFAHLQQRPVVSLAPFIRKLFIYSKADRFVLLIYLLARFFSSALR